VSILSTTPLRRLTRFSSRPMGLPNVGYTAEYTDILFSFCRISCVKVKIHYIKQNIRRTQAGYLS
jgi:hypothetical protein